MTNICQDFETQSNSSCSRLKHTAAINSELSSSHHHHACPSSMDRISATDFEQSNLEWIQSYPFNVGAASNPSNLFYQQPDESWRPSLGLNTYDFTLDEAIAANRKTSSASNALSHSSFNGVSPSPSLFPSVSSVQSSPHTSPTLVDPALRESLHRSSGHPTSMGCEGIKSAPSGLKRNRDQFEQPPPRNVKLDEENRYLVYLRDQQRLPWKEISRKFEQTFQRPYQAPALQMRYGRLKSRLHPWTDADTNALQLAQEYYANKRFEIIAEKMVEFGATDAWGPRVCARKLRRLEKDAGAIPGSPTPSQSSEDGLKQSVDHEHATTRASSPQLAGNAIWKLS